MSISESFCNSEKSIKEAAVNKYGLQQNALSVILRNEWMKKIENCIKNNNKMRNSSSDLGNLDLFENLDYLSCFPHL